MFYKREIFEKLLKTNIFTLFSIKFQGFKVVISVCCSVLLCKRKKKFFYMEPKFINNILIKTNTITCQKY